MRLSVTAYSLRAVDRAGGIDNYILGTSDEKLNSTQAMGVKGRLLEILGDEAKERVRLAKETLDQARN